MEWALLVLFCFLVAPVAVASDPMDLKNPEPDWYFPLIEDIAFDDKFRTGHEAANYGSSDYGSFRNVKTYAYKIDGHDKINSPVALMFFNIEWCQVVSLHIGPQFRVKLYPSAAYYEIYDGKTLKGTHEFHSAVMEVYPEGDKFYFYVDGSAYAAYQGQNITDANKEYAQPTAAIEDKDGVSFSVFTNSPYCRVLYSFNGITTDGTLGYFHRGNKQPTPYNHFDHFYPGRTLPTVVNTAGSKRAVKCPSPIELAYFMADDVWAEEATVNSLEYVVTFKPDDKGSWKYVLLEVAREQCDWIRICYEKDCTDNSPSLDILYRNQVYFRSDDDRPYPFPVPATAFEAITLYPGTNSLQFDIAALEGDRLWDVPMYIAADGGIYPDKPLHMFLQRAPGCKARLLTEPFSKMTAVCQNGPMA